MINILYMDEYMITEWNKLWEMGQYSYKIYILYMDKYKINILYMNKYMIIK